LDEMNGGAASERATAEAVGVEAPGDLEAAHVARLRRGDRGAFERLYRPRAGQVHGLCLRLSRNATEAEEMTQEVFVRAWQHRERFVDGTHFIAWLKRVAVNLAVNARRDVARRGVPRSLDDAPAEPPDPRIPRPALGADLERAIATLPDGARTAFVLHDVHGYKHEEIARMTGIAIGTSKAQLHRARRRLREELR
jgi:RNA polymerase sigma-70 factor (ECF subfamily)